jgi:Ner family transcriptional regulator
MSPPVGRKNKHPELVKADIRVRFGSIQALADKARIEGSILRASLRRCVPAGNRVIAKHLGASVNAIWPEWFDEYGNPRSSSCRKTPKASKRKQLNDRQKGAAA